MKLVDKTLELENDKFKIIEFDNERYEKIIELICIIRYNVKMW